MANSMQYRYLGKTGLQVSVLSLGGWLTYGGQVSDDITYRCMKRAYELGVNFFDTAEVYAEGQSETDMGLAIKKLNVPRSSLVISTKIFWGGSGVNDAGLSRKHIIEGVKASLKRLDLEYVDLIFAHRPDPDTPMEEIVRAFNWVIEKGWAFYWGTSEWSAQQLTEAHMVAKSLNLIGPAMEQPEYNLFARQKIEAEYLPIYQQFGLGTTIWSPLASGILTGKYKPHTNPPEGSRLAMKNNPFVTRMRGSMESEEGQEKLRKVEKLQEIAKKLNCTVAQLSIAWCARNPNVSTVILGASRVEQVEENIKSLEVLGKLTDDVMEEIENIVGTKPVQPPNFRTAFKTPKN